jgi:hypothetical protein
MAWHLVSYCARATNFIHWRQRLAALVKELLEELWNQLRPPRTFSWQTLVLLSLFSWALSILVETLILKDLLSRFGWLFLTVGVGWALSDNKLNILGLEIQTGPWITGALACVVIFAGWVGDLGRVAWVSWPIFSAISAAVPHFFPRFTFSIPDPKVRQDLILRAVLAGTMSCWIQFHFVVQDWLRDYPTLLSDDFRQSAFVVRLDEEQRDPSRSMSRAELLLNLAEGYIETSLEGILWSDTERWLIALDQQIPALQKYVFELANRSANQGLAEDALWRFSAVVPPGEPEYTLRLRMLWTGPTSTNLPYAYEKACLISRVTPPLGAGEVVAGAPLTRVDCNPFRRISLAQPP